MIRVALLCKVHVSAAGKLPMAGFRKLRTGFQWVGGPARFRYLSAARAC